MEFGEIPVGLILFASVMASVVPAVIGYIWLRLGKINNIGLILPIAFINAINLPLPIIKLAWGGPGVAVATVFFTLQFIPLLIFGILIIAKEDKMKEVFKMPYIYVVAFALFLNWQNVKLPVAIDSLLSMCGDMAYPLMLIIMGIILYRSFANVSLKQIKLAVFAAFIRLIAGVATAFAVVFVFGIEGISRDVLLFYGIMPGAIMTTLFAEKYNRDSEVVSQTVFFGTLMSMALIPVALMILL
jgi:hypothetical protein